MSTTPSTSNKPRIPYTVLGGDRSGLGGEVPFSVVVLNRGSRIYKTEMLTQIERLKPAEIISIEGNRETYDLEPLARRFPRVRFVCVHRTASVGEYLNIGMEEAKGTFVLVIWNEMRLAQLSQRGLERVAEQTGLCTVPALLNPRNEMIPTLMAPGFHHKHLKVVPFVPKSDGLLTLYPFDHAGLYRRQLYLQLGGFDPAIRNEHWQLLDFGFRAYLWGERITSSAQFRITLANDPPAEDTTPDESYRRFYLKNLSVRFDKDSGVLPKSRFLPFYFRSGASFFEASRLFREVRDWVELHRFRFVQDARSIAELWEVPES